MKQTKKRAAALLLALAMVLSLAPMAFAADFPDMPAEDDASYAAVKSAVDNNIMSGENGKLNLDGTILRSTMAKMVTMAFGAKNQADMSGYPDAKDNWATSQGYLPAAVAMGIMSGSNGKMMPGVEVTMQEVAAMLARALGLEPGTAADLEGVEGADSVSTWAIPYVAALVKAGYLPDAAAANKPMSRKAFAEVLYKVSGEGNYVKEGEITEDVDGNIVITSDGVSLKGITVKGDVIIADGVDAGSIVLDGVNIEGRLVVRGGSKAALTNGTKAAGTVVAKPSGEVTVSADAQSDAGSINVAGTHGQNPEKVVLDMAEPKATVTAATNLAIQNATGGEVTLAAPGAAVAVESGTVSNVTVAEGVTDAKVDVAKDATIEKVTSNTDLTVTGEGKVEEKEGSGTVTDASGSEVAGSNEPAVIPEGISTPADPHAPQNDTHTWYWSEEATPFDAGRHTYECVGREAGTDEDGNEISAVDPCGAIRYEAHDYNEQGVCKACEAPKPGAVTEGEAGDTPADGMTACGAEGAEHDEHKFVADAKSKDNKAATCAAPGKKAMVCAYCGVTRTDTVNALGHDYKATATQAATCDEDGLITYTCTRCTEEDEGHTEEVPITATPQHTWKLVEVKVADCKTGGYKLWECTTCTGETPATDRTDVTEANADAHVWGEEATFSADGKHTYSCTVTDCDGSKEEVCSLKADNSCYKAHSCKAYSEGVYGQAAGTVCTKCGHQTVGEIIDEPAAHKYSANWTNTDATNHWHECTVCGDKNGDKAAHTWNDGGSAEKPGSYCTVCHYAVKAAEPCENEAKHASLHTGQKCAKCDYVGKANHTAAEAWSKDANKHWHACTGDGCTAKLDEAAHTYSGGGENKAGTCTCGTACADSNHDSKTQESPCACGYYKGTGGGGGGG